jgi:hypothetical protein
VYRSEWLTAAALTQTYAYMIENGLEYSKLQEKLMFSFRSRRMSHILLLPPRRTQHRTEVKSIPVSCFVAPCRPDFNLLLNSTRLEASQPEMAESNARDWDRALERLNVGLLRARSASSRAMIDHESILRQIPNKEILRPR